MSFDTDGIEKAIISTLVMLCKNSITYNAELKIQGLLGITVDETVLLVQINEQFMGSCEKAMSGVTQPLPMKRQRLTPMTVPRRAPLMRRSMPVSSARRGRGGGLGIPNFRARHQLFPGPSRMPSGRHKLRICEC